MIRAPSLSRPRPRCSIASAARASYTRGSLLFFRLNHLRWIIVHPILYWCHLIFISICLFYWGWMICMAHQSSPSHGAWNFVKRSSSEREKKNTMGMCCKIPRHEMCTIEDWSFSNIVRGYLHHMLISCPFHNNSSRINCILELSSSTKGHLITICQDIILIGCLSEIRNFPLCFIKE